MGKINNSDSREQREAEDILFNAVQDWLDVFNLQRNPSVRLTDSSPSYIVPDFYSESHRIIGEIFAHIGKPKRGQHNKIANDILKMLLLEKTKQCKYRKIIVVCDEIEENSLRGKSFLAECIRQFDVEIKRIKLNSDMQNRILKAQNRQKMVNQ